MEFCKKCGSLIKSGKCSAKCAKRPAVKWGEESRLIMMKLKNDHDLILQPRKRHPDLGGKVR